MSKADIIFSHARVFTADDSNSRADKVVVKGNKIIFCDEGGSHNRQILAEVSSGYTKDAAYTEFQEAKKADLRRACLLMVFFYQQMLTALKQQN